MRLRRQSTHRPALAALAIVLAVGAAYHDSFHGSFILDDAASITLNPSIRQLWPLTSPPIGGVTGGRPLANFSFALNYAMSGFGVWSYHATNLLLHALTALVLFGVVRRTLLLPSLRARFASVALPLAATAAGLWALHPVQTAAVDYVSQRTELMMGLFYLLTLYAFLRSTETAARFWPSLAVAACACGMASKEVMATAPVLVLLCDRTFVAGTFRAALRQRWRFYAGLAATWLLLAALVVGSHLRERGAGFSLGVTPLDYALTETRALVHYLGLSLWPHPLIFDHGREFAHHLIEVWPCALALLLLGAGTLGLLWRRPAFGFLPASFFLLLLPTSSFVPISEQPLAESRLYLPLAAVVTGLTLLLFDLLRRRTLPLAITAAGLAFLALTAHRTADYRSEVSIWRDTVARKPTNPRAHRTLGDALVNAGRLDEALPCFQTALQLQPDYWQAHYNLGNACFSLGRYADAVTHFEAALRLQPEYPANLHNNLANAFLRLARPDAAIPHYQAALRLQPDYAGARHNLALACSDLGAHLIQAQRFAEAVTPLQAAIQINPDYADAWHNLSRAFHGLAQLPPAIEAARHAVRLRPNVPTTLLNLGNLLFATGQFDDAIATYTAVLRVDPLHAEAHNNLGLALLRTGRPAEARERFTTALRLKPDYAEARANLELVPANR